MKIYQIAGLGADERVFSFLNIDVDCTTIHWIDPFQKESIQSYASRLVSQIDTREKFGILGVSFGGIIALELGKIIQPEVIILISSVEKDNQLPLRLRSIGKMGILHFIPNAFIKPPKLLQGFLFSAVNKKLLHAIIKDTDPNFIRWALEAIIHWSHTDNAIPCIRIHGTKDRLIPLKSEAIKIQGGGHFMIVDKAEELSTLVNKQLSILKLSRE